MLAFYQHISPAQRVDSTGDPASMRHLHTSQTIVFRPGMSFAAVSSAFALTSLTDRRGIRGERSRDFFSDASGAGSH